jgi:hypothetical protein
VGKSGGMAMLAAPCRFGLVRRLWLYQPALPAFTRRVMKPVTHPRRNFSFRSQKAAAGKLYTVPAYLLETKNKPLI